MIPPSLPSPHDAPGRLDADPAPAGTSVAVVPSSGLGDGLIQIVLANGLRAAGYDVTYYHDGVHRLRERLPGLRTCPLPERSAMLEALAAYDVVLFDAGAYFLTASPLLRAWMIEHGIGYSMGRDAPPRAEIGPTRTGAPLVALNRSLRAGPLRWPRPPLARQVAAQVARRLGLGAPSIDLGVVVPRPDAPSRRTRVCIHPEASMPKKCWDPECFLQLASALGANGWTPVLTVAPWEHERWLQLAEGRAEVVTFADEVELADYYAASRAFIGNDSGNAHVASLVGLPSVVLFRHRGRFPTWRAAWRRPTVVAPRVLGRGPWQKRISVARVERAFYRSVGERSPG
ncbi:MAG: glycosyltransferase family 9 protein [Planctomycetota bacterium]